MKRSKLKYLALHITDGEHTSVTDDANGNCFLLSNKNIVDSNIVITNTDRKINQQTLDRLNKRTKLDIGDVVVSTVGSIGKTAIIKEKPNYDFQRSVGIIKCNEEQILPEYLLYYLNLPSVQKRLIKLSKGAIQKCLFINDLEELLIDHPETIEEQKKIVSSLIEIDQQIQRNNDMVHKLQVLAQTTYSRWFNQFEFPNGDGLPYKSSGGKMIWNNELKREIPENWNAKMLGDLLTKNTEKLQDYNNIPTIDLSVMQPDNFALGELNTSNNFTTNLFVMHKGDLMFGSIRPYLHKAGIAPCDGAFAGTVHSYKPIDNTDYNVCLSALISNDIFSFAVKNAKGTKMPVIASDDLLQYKIPYNKGVSKQFTKLLDIKNIVCNCMMQNNMLVQLKNNILPLLINGQLNI